MNAQLREVYETLFVECSINDKDLRNALVLFVEGEGVANDEFAVALDQDEHLQEFVEKAFALKFAPLQQAVVPERCEQKEPALEGAH